MQVQYYTVGQSTSLFFADILMCAFRIGTLITVGERDIQNKVKESYGTVGLPCVLYSTVL